MLCTTALPWLKHLDPGRLASGTQEQRVGVREDEMTFTDGENSSFKTFFF